MGGVINTALDQKSCPSRGEHRDRIATAGKYFLPNTDPPPQALSLFPWAEHQLSKPDVVSQLEEEEELWSVERGIPQDTFSGENQAHGSPGTGVLVSEELVS